MLAIRRCVVSWCITWTLAATIALAISVSVVNAQDDPFAAIPELMEQYELEGLADEILAGRVAMYLIRIARAEAYESALGVTDKSVLWGKYIRGLDNTLRGIMRDLAVTRAKRKELEKGDELMVSVDDLLKKFVKKSERRARKLVQVQKRRVSRAHMRTLIDDWRKS